MAYRLEELIDIGQFQQLQDRLNEIYSFPSAIIDNEGNVLTATGWQDVCVKFHRAHPESRTECIKSDRYIIEHLDEADPAVSYVCPHGLVDNATPIVIDGVHYGNFFTGQFFLQQPDLAFFKAQAERYGFDEPAYLEAVRKVPVWSRQQLGSYLFFIKGLIEVISGIGLKNLKEIDARRQVKENEEFIRSILDTVDEGFIVVDREYRILTANKAYCRQVGGCADETVGAHCYEVSHRQRRPCFEKGEECAVRQVFETGEPAAALHRHHDRSGHLLFVETKAYPIRDESGAVVSAIETIHNITEKHLLEEEQLKSQKLESIGTLAGGIAHDFNNLLQGVFGFISMAKRTLDQNPAGLAMLEQAEKALQLSVNLTTQLLTFSKGGNPVRKKLALQPVVENAARFALSGSRVDCRVSADAPRGMVDADEGQISQVIQNLVLNAEQAMPLGGTIVITLRNVAAPGRGAPSVLPKGDYVEIAVRDSGIGIPQQYLSKIFDPYFTTKEKGSGLGLATSYSIVRNHGGVLTAASEPGQGSTFRVYLPALTEAAAPAEPGAPAGSPARRGRVLVMDDEELIRDIAGAMLEALGHDVALARDGAEALEKFREGRRAGRGFDIVILDLTIRGGMGGRETVRQLRELAPDVKAVMSSGYADNAAIAEARALGFRACLRKPYNIEQLNATLNALLA